MTEISGRLPIAVPVAMPVQRYQAAGPKSLLGKVKRICQIRRVFPSRDLRRYSRCQVFRRPKRTLGWMGAYLHFLEWLARRLQQCHLRADIVKGRQGSREARGIPTGPT